MKISCSGRLRRIHAVGWGGLSTRRPERVEDNAFHRFVCGNSTNADSSTSPSRRLVSFGVCTRASRRVAGAFSLLEVVAAIGVLAVALVAVLGLILATVRSAGETADADAAARLFENVQGEFERLQADLGPSVLASAVPPSDSAQPLRLVATRNGLRVRCADRRYAAADRALNDPALPGIANRDRYFLIEVTQLPGLETEPASGFLACSARITWPYELAMGPPTAGATAWDADPAREVPANERSLAIVSFALRP